jgi:hypothetical protein
MSEPTLLQYPCLLPCRLCVVARKPTGMALSPDRPCCASFPGPVRPGRLALALRLVIHQRQSLPWVVRCVVQVLVVESSGHISVRRSFELGVSIDIHELLSGQWCVVMRNLEFQEVVLV